MCVDSSQSRLFGRAEFLAAMAAVTSPLVAAPALATPASAPARASARLTVPAGLRSGNHRAAAIAASSPLVIATYTETRKLVATIGDATLRKSVLALLDDPRPMYAQKYPTAESRASLRDALIREGFVAAGTSVEAIFPPGTEAGAKHAPQPFWCAAGSGEDSHHSYPGGLLVHEYFNASISTSFASTYDRVYFNARNAVDRDIVIGAALYHDIMKTVVFQWNDDGTLLNEVPIGATGGHHVLSGAEAIARGRSPRFVIALLSAHASPSLGDEAKVATWCRAAALVAGVDPVQYGLVKKDGFGYTLAPTYVPLEAFVSYLSDHDFVLSIHAAREVLLQLQRLAPKYIALGRDAGATGGKGRYSSFAWFKNDMLSHLSAIGLYQTLAAGGEAAFDRAIARFNSPG